MHLSKVTLIILFFELANSGRNTYEVLNTTAQLDIESKIISKKKKVESKIFSLQNPLLPDVPDFNVTQIYATTFSPNALAIQGSNSQNFIIFYRGAMSLMILLKMMMIRGFISF